MDDPKQPSEPSSLPLPGAERRRVSADVPGFFPLRLLLFPNGCSIELNRPDMIMGRHTTADVRLHLPDVSRHHCRFLFSDGAWHIIDLHSMNGVFVNDERVHEAVVHPHDLIRVGSYIFEAAVGEESPSAPLPASGLKTLGSIADALSPIDDQPQRRAS